MKRVFIEEKVHGVPECSLEMEITKNELTEEIISRMIKDFQEIVSKSSGSTYVLIRSTGASATPARSDRGRSKTSSDHIRISSMVIQSILKTNKLTQSQLAVLIDGKRPQNIQTQLSLIVCAKSGIGPLMAKRLLVCTERGAIKIEGRAAMEFLRYKAEEP